jgi:hypothetical protein
MKQTRPSINRQFEFDPIGFAQWLFAQRKERGWSTRELAEQTNQVLSALGSATNVQTLGCIGGRKLGEDIKLDDFADDDSVATEDDLEAKLKSAEPISLNL